jgi:hypothetical protein
LCKLVLVSQIENLTNTSGELAQLVERSDRTAEVRGSNPLLSILAEP